MLKAWEEAAIRELIDVVKILSANGFENRSQLLNRLQISRESIELLEEEEESISPQNITPFKRQHGEHF